MTTNKLGAAARRLLPANRFARSVSVLAGGTAAGQAIVVAASPILTRLYTPDEFGVLAVFASLLGILSVIASLRYQLAIPLPESDKEAASITVLSLLVVAGMVAISGALVALFGASALEVLNAPALIPYLWLLPLGLLLTGTYQVFQYWAIREKAFPAIARTKVAQAMTKVVVQTGGHALGPIALLAGHILGGAAGSSSLGILALSKRRELFRRVELGSVARAAKRYRRFPLFSSWAELLSAAGVKVPPLLFAALFHPAAAGIYLLTQRVLTTPMQVFSQAIANVLHSSAIDARNEGRLRSLVAKIHAKLAHIAMPPALILSLAGADVFAFVFGEDWRQAGVFAQWMAPWMYMVFITVPLNRLLAVLEKQPQGMLFQGILFITRISSLVLGAYLGDLVIAVAIFAMGSALCWLGFLAWIIRVTGNPWCQVWKPHFEAFRWGAVVVLPFGLFYAFAESPIVWFIAAVVSGSMMLFRYRIILRAN